MSKNEEKAVSKKQAKTLYNDLRGRVEQSKEIVPVFTLTSATGGVCDKTFAEVQSAMQEGRCNRAVANYLNHMISLGIDGYVENNYIQFSYIGIVSDSIIPHVTKTTIVLSSNNTASFDQFVVNDNSSSIAPMYEDITFPIASGSICYHDGKLYKAKQDIPVLEVWTAAHWDETTVEEVIAATESRLNGAINAKYTKPSGGIPGTDLADAYIEEPTSPATGAFLVYNGSAWVGQTLSTWQGGNY